ncbi:hypothetical protein LCGC14_1650660 [marine sediment metagenome]|uniref:Uncharacterized protein n=1 Tax=marine sediment metagenome TaxID=412755 RepID=A0A0F9IJE6_9ZZZZ
MYDGTGMKRMLREALLESPNTSFLLDHVSYQFLWEAASNWLFRTNSLRASETITTVANQAEYTLAPDHLDIYPDDNGDKFIQYNNGSVSSFPRWKPYSEILHRATNPSVAIPGRFTVIDHPTLADIITGTATAVGTSSRGLATLSDSGGGFSGNVSVGDVVHNTTQTFFGIVISVTSDTALVTAMFTNTASNQSWADTNAYTIIPQARLRLILSPPPTTASHTLTINYISRPAPVFSADHRYRIQSQYISEIIRDAKALYEFRGGDYEIGTADKQLSDRGITIGNIRYDKTFGRKGFKVGFRGLR